MRARDAQTRSSDVLDDARDLPRLFSRVRRGRRVVEGARRGDPLRLGDPGPLCARRKVAREIRRIGEGATERVRVERVGGDGSDGTVDRDARVDVDLV